MSDVEYTKVDTGPLKDLDELTVTIEDASQREFVILMRTLVSDVIQVSNDNSKAIAEMGRRMKDHIEAYSKQTEEIKQWKNQGLGMWKVAGWVFLALQGVVGVGVNYLSNRATALEQTLAEIRQSITTSNATVTRLETEVRAMRETSPPDTVDAKPRKRR